MSDVTMDAQANLDRTMSSLKDGVAGATAGMGQAGAQAQAAARDGMQTMMKMAGDVLALSRGNFDALTRSGQVLATGAQDMGRSVAAAARDSLEETIDTFKAMATVKSFKEAMDLQSSLMRSALERAVSQASQMTDRSMKLSEQAFAPIGAQLSSAADKFGRIG